MHFFPWSYRIMTLKRKVICIYSTTCENEIYDSSSAQNSMKELHITLQNFLRLLSIELQHNTKQGNRTEFHNINTPRLTRGTKQTMHNNKRTTQNTTSSSHLPKQVWTIIDDHQTPYSVFWSASRSEKVVVAPHRGCSWLDCWWSSVRIHTTEMILWSTILTYICLLPAFQVHSNSLHPREVRT